MTHLKIEERYAIYEMNKAGYSSRAIGKKIIIEGKARYVMS